MEDIEVQLKIMKLTTKTKEKENRLEEKTEKVENEAKEESKDKVRQKIGVKEKIKLKEETIQKTRQIKEWPKGEIVKVRIRRVWWESKIVKEVDEGIVINIPRMPRTRKTENKWERETE